MYHKLFSLQEDIFKVIANQKRLELIQLLKNRELSVSEMVEMANLSQHLSLLRLHGVVTSRKEGLNVYYKLTDVRIAEATLLIREFLTSQNKLDPVTVLRISKDEGALYPIVLDPVCRMRISASEAGSVIEHKSQAVYFCAVGCRDKFVANPEQYDLTSKEV
jgi:DNA-binding transcriptional ArsR family regulator/YHS domain-containing protein